MEKGRGRRGTYHLQGKKPEIPGGKSNGSAIPYGKVQKTWAVILGNTIFYSS